MFVRKEGARSWRGIFERKDSAKKKRMRIDEHDRARSEIDGIVSSVAHPTVVAQGVISGFIDEGDEK